MSSDTLPNLTQQMLDMARKAGADAADAIAITSTSQSVDVRGGDLESAERSESTDIGLRVFVGPRQAIVSGSDTSDATIGIMAERAVAMAREAPEDAHCGLAETGDLATDWDLEALELSDPAEEPAPAALQEAAAATEAAALAVEGIEKVDPAQAAYSATDVHLAASNGFSGAYRRTTTILGCTAIAGAGLGMERDSAYEGRIFAADLPSPDEIGQTAAERTLARLDARKPPTGAYPVLFDERIAGHLIGYLLGAANGSSIARGSSWLRDKLGEQVLPKGMDIIENPHRARSAASRPFDAEGLPTAQRSIVADGVLQGWTLDLANARKLGLQSTANAARSLSHGVSPSNWNIDLTQGSQSRDALLRDMGTGLLVTSMIGATVNANTGDYSRGAAGHWVENGEIAYAVNECTIAGNLLDMLIDMVPANDARPHLSRRIPSLLVSGLTLAGN